MAKKNSIFGKLVPSKKEAYEGDQSERSKFSANENKSVLWD